MFHSITANFKEFVLWHSQYMSPPKSKSINSTKQKVEKTDNEVNIDPEHLA